MLSLVLFFFLAPLRALLPFPLASACCGRFGKKFKPCCSAIYSVFITFSGWILNAECDISVRFAYASSSNRITRKLSVLLCGSSFASKFD
jgi:hypothetical protein